MQIFRNLDELAANTNRSVVSVGNFDGVHLGHQLVLKSMVDRARELEHNPPLSRSIRIPRTYCIVRAALR